MIENRFISSLKSRSGSENNRLGSGCIVFLFILALISITICSKSSPLYPLNNWDDANCFYTVGRATLNGQVMYRDIFEQKGPWLYFIYMLASLISGSSFFGAYIIEVLSFFAFLVLCARIILLFCDRKAVLLMPLLATTVCTAPAFEQGGSAEELCLPMIAYGFYVGLKSIVNEKPVTKREWLLVGITSGAVLWIKFSLLGFYLGCGAFLVFYYIKKKWHRELITFLLMLLLGVILNLFEGTKSFLYSFGFGCALMICGGICLFFRSKRLFGFLLCTSISTFLLIYVGGRRYIYYSLILSVFASLGIVFIYKLLQLIPEKKPNSPGINTAFGCCMLGYTLMTSLIWSPNTYMMSYSKEDMPQYKFAEVISQTENATILNFRFLDGGFYTASGILPSCRFFCGLNIPYATSEQDRYVRDGDVDYLITRDKPIYYDNYELILSESFEAHKNEFTEYYLYKKTDS